MTVAASIVITAYNYRAFVEHCVQSCLAQGSPDEVEVIVVDDGSDDGTPSLLHRFGNRIRLLSGTNRGVEAAANWGFREARGQYVVRVDADDWLQPGFLSRTLTVLDANRVEFVYTNYYLSDIQGHDIGEICLPEFLAAEIRLRGDFLATGTLYRRSSVMKFGPYAEQVRNCGLENYELILNLLAGGGRGQLLGESLFHYRLHATSLNVTRRQAIIDYGRLLAGKFDLGDYRTNQYHPYGLTLS